MPYNTQRLFVVLAALVALLAGAGVSWWTQHSTPYKTVAGTLWPVTPPLAAVTLTDHNGQVFDRARLRGRWTLFFFGYTHCPDICPSTLGMLNDVAQRLKGSPAGEQLQFVFVSVDPERDTVATLKSYLNYFNPHFIGLTGTPAAITALTQQFSLPVARQGTGQDYQVDHSATLILTNPDARQYAVFSSPHQSALIAQDLMGLIQ